MNKKKILGISGSLRLQSSNTAVLRAIQSLTPQEVNFTIYPHLRQIPIFSPELDNDNPPSNVLDLRQEVKNADAVIFSTPEYAFGLPGVLKNALDWLVSSGEFNEKPVFAISGSTTYMGGDKALASLCLTLTALGTQHKGQLAIPSIKKKRDEQGEFVDPNTLAQLKLGLDSLLNL